MATFLPPAAAGPPNDGARRADEAVRTLASNLIMRGAGSERAVETEVTAPIPCFRLELESFDQPDVLAHARLTGWRYLVLGAGDASIADFVKHEEDSEEIDPVIATDPQAVQSIISAGLLGEDAMRLREAGPFEVRLLSTFAGPERWLWFHCALVPYGNDDIVVSLDPNSTDIIPAVDFVADLVERAEARASSERNIRAHSSDDNETGG